MKAKVSGSEVPHRKRGGVLVLVAISMAVLLGVTALAVDLGWFFVTRNQLQNISDAGALAATRHLGGIYQSMPYSAHGTFRCDAACEHTLDSVAQYVATRHLAGGVAMTVRVEDVLVGQWRHQTFTQTDSFPNAVQVFARRDGTANGEVSTFFARVLGVGEAPVTALAIAAMTGQGTAAEGEVELPIGISEWFFENPADPEFCDQDIQFYPSNDPASCAGWTSWDYGSNDVTLRNIMELPENPAYESPTTIAYESIFNFTGGTLSNPTFDALLTLFQHHGHATDANGNYLTGSADGRIDAWEALDPQYGAVELQQPDNQGVLVQATYPDGTPRYLHKWETTVPVYQATDCANPNQSILIVGFAQIELIDVLNSPDKLVRGKLVCNRVGQDDDRGGGGEYGIMGPIPGLVK